MYQLLRNLLFLLPAERAHYVSMNLLSSFCRVSGIRSMVRSIFTLDDSRLARKLFGLNFRNPVGLGAGFDKNARYLDVLETLGFGFVEIGTVTPRPQAGNPQPRLFRLKKDGALINRMGFNNDGVDTIVKRLKEWRRTSSLKSSVLQGTFLIGGNIGKNKDTPNDEAWKDYEICFRALHPYVDFFVVNVSSPNTPGLRELQEKDALKKILVHLQQLDTTFGNSRPILLKIAPDLTPGQVDDVINLAKEIQLEGLVVSNTTVIREGLKTSATELEQIGAGGVSGKPVKEKSDDLVRYIHQRTGGDIPIIGSGGISSEEDAMEKLEAGASLIEVWTGFIYEGPGLAKRICRRMVKGGEGSGNRE